MLPFGPVTFILRMCTEVGWRGRFMGLTGNFEENNTDFP